MLLLKRHSQSENMENRKQSPQHSRAAKKKFFQLKTESPITHQNQSSL